MMQRVGIFALLALAVAAVWWLYSRDGTATAPEVVARERTSPAAETHTELSGTANARSPSDTGHTDAPTTREKPGAVPAAAPAGKTPPPDKPMPRPWVPDLALGGRVTDVDGDPIKGALVDVVGIGKAMRTGADGSFRLRMKHPGNVGPIRLKVSAEGYRTRRVPAHLHGMRNVIALWCVRSIAGLVVDQHGAAVVGAALRGSHASSEERFDAETDGRGQFTVDDASDGPWTVSVTPAKPGLFLRPTPTDVMGGDRSARIVLQRRSQTGARVLITLVRHGTGERLSPGWGSLRPPGEPDGGDYQLPGDDENGQMVFADVGPGQWLALVSDEPETGFAVFTLDVKPFDTIVERQIAIGPPGAVIVELDLSDIPRESFPGQVNVKMVDHRGTEPFDLGRRPTETRLEGVPPNTDVALELDSSEVFGRATVRVGFGETKRVRIRAQALGFFGIASEDRLPEGWVHLTLEDARGHSIHAETTRIRAGGFQYSDRIPPGKIRWTLHFRAGHRRLMPADVRAGAASPGVQVLRGTGDLRPSHPIDYALRMRDGLLRMERD